MALEVDALGLCCPLPLMRLQQAIGPLAAGSRLALLADDPGVEDDLPLWCQQGGHRLLLLEQRQRHWYGLVEKGGE